MSYTILLPIIIGLIMLIGLTTYISPSLKLTRLALNVLNFLLVIVLVSSWYTVINDYPQSLIGWTWLAAHGVQFQFKFDIINLIFVTIAIFSTFTIFLEKKVSSRKKIISLSLGSLLAFICAVTSQDLLALIMFSILSNISIFLLLGRKNPTSMSPMTTIVPFFFTALLPMLGIVWLADLFYEQYGYYSTTFENLYKLRFTEAEETSLLLLFMAPIIMRLPLWPFHILSLKSSNGSSVDNLLQFFIQTSLAVFMAIRICLPLFSSALEQLQNYLLTLCFISLFYSAIAIWMQDRFIGLVKSLKIYQAALLAIAVIISAQHPTDKTSYNAIFCLLLGFVIHHLIFVILLKLTSEKLPISSAPSELFSVGRTSMVLRYIIACFPGSISFLGLTYLVEAEISTSYVTAALIVTSMIIASTPLFFSTQIINKFHALLQASGTSLKTKAIVLSLSAISMFLGLMWHSKISVPQIYKSSYRIEGQLKHEQSATRKRFGH